MNPVNKTAASLVPHVLKTLHQASGQAQQHTRAPAASQHHNPAANVLNSQMLFSQMMGEKLSGGKAGEKGIRDRRLNRTGQLKKKEGVSKVEELGELATLLGMGSDSATEEQMNLLREALYRVPGPTAEELLEIAGGDPAVCDNLLNRIQAGAEAKGDTRLNELATAQISHLNNKYGEHIRAGKNSAVAIDEGVQELQQIDSQLDVKKAKFSLRNLYYKLLSHAGQTPNAMLDLALGHATKPAEVMPILRSLASSLADDIASMASSISTKALHTIQHGLRDAGHLINTVNVSGTLLKHIGGKFPDLDITHNPINLTQKLLRMSEGDITPDFFADLGHETVGDGVSPQLMFLNRLVPVIMMLPLSLWKELGHRDVVKSLLGSEIKKLAQIEQDMALRNNEAGQVRNRLSRL